MVGLPARGKSYITKKIARYLNWQQHNTRIFNVGERRRVAAGGQHRATQPESHTQNQPGDLMLPASHNTAMPNGIISQRDFLDPPTIAAKILINDQYTTADETATTSTSEHDKVSEALAPQERSCADTDMPPADRSQTSSPEGLPGVEPMEQSASFFDPRNRKAAQIREQVALSTLDELLDFILEQGGSVGILDATNSTLERRKLIMKRVRERAGPELGVLFLESQCVDPNVCGIKFDPPKLIRFANNWAAFGVEYAIETLRPGL